MKRNCSKKAFTLAEVLITLVIIGVIAAITVPTLMQNTERQEFVTRLKKADSVLKQISYKIAMDSGYPVGDYSFMENDDFFESFAQNINHIQKCTEANQGCFTPDTIKALNGSNWAKYDRVNSLVAADGITYGWHNGQYCTGKGLSSDDERNCIGRFIVDVNGQKAPNMFGRDVFFFGVINDKGIVPAGEANGSADCKRGSNGITCAAKVLRENKIAY